MELLRLGASIVNAALLIDVFVLFARIILDFIPVFNREWRPKGPVLLVAEAAYTVTDPPIRLVRRVIPPLRAGGVAIDLAWTIVLLAAIVLSYIAAAFIR